MRQCPAFLIAGMGGELIEKILAEGSEKAARFESFVFSPHTKVPEFRCFLGRNGYCIRDERVMSEDGKFYTIIKAEHGEDACHDSFDYEFGPLFEAGIRAGSKAYVAYRAAVEGRMLQLTQVLDGADNLPEGRRNELSEELGLYRTALQKLDDAAH